MKGCEIGRINLPTYEHYNSLTDKTQSDNCRTNDTFHIHSIFLSTISHCYTYWIILFLWWKKGSLSSGERNFPSSTGAYIYVTCGIPRIPISLRSPEKECKLNSGLPDANIRAAGAARGWWTWPRGWCSGLRKTPRLVRPRQAAAAGASPDNPGEPRASRAEDIPVFTPLTSEPTFFSASKFGSRWALYPLLLDVP